MDDGRYAQQRLAPELARSDHETDLDNAAMMSPNFASRSVSRPVILFKFQLTTLRKTRTINRFDVSSLIAAYVSPVTTRIQSTDFFPIGYGRKKNRPRSPMNRDLMPICADREQSAFAVAGGKNIESVRVQSRKEISALVHTRALAASKAAAWFGSQTGRVPQRQRVRERKCGGMDEPASGNAIALQPSAGWSAAAMGDDGRSHVCTGCSCVRRRVPGREQRPDCRQITGSRTAGGCTGCGSIAITPAQNHSTKTTANFPGQIPRWCINR